VFSATHFIVLCFKLMKGKNFYNVINSYRQSVHASAGTLPRNRSLRRNKKNQFPCKQNVLFSLLLNYAYCKLPVKKRNL